MDGYIREMETILNDTIIPKIIHKICLNFYYLELEYVYPSCYKIDRLNNKIISKNGADGTCFIGKWMNKNKIYEIIFKIDIWKGSFNVAFGLGPDDTTINKAAQFCSDVGYVYYTGGSVFIGRKSHKIEKAIAREGDTIKLIYNRRIKQSHKLLISINEKKSIVLFDNIKDNKYKWTVSLSSAPNDECTILDIKEIET